MTLAHASPPARRPLHLADRWAVLKRHWFAATVALLLVFGWIVTRALLATPIYAAAAKIHLTDAGTGTSLLGDLAEMDGPSEVQTEMEVMRSFSVALGAARIVARHGAEMPVQRLVPDLASPWSERTGSPQDPPRAPALAAEVHAYRPLETFLRSIRTQRPPGKPVDILTPPLPEGQPNIGFRITFNEDATQVTMGVPGVSAKDRPTLPFQSGVPFDVAGHSITIRHDPEDLAGRRYDITLMSVQDAANWIHRGRFVTPIGRNTGILQVGFRAHTPDLAQRGAQALALSYLEHRHQQRQGELGTGLKWIEAQIQRITKQLTVAEERLDTFVREHDAAHLSERASSILVNIAQLDARLSEIDHERSRLEFERARLRTNMPFDQQLRLLGNEASNPVTTAIATSYVEMSRERSTLLKEQTWEHPGVKRLTGQIDEARDQLQAAAREIVRNRLAVLDQQIKTLERRDKDVRQRLKRHDGEIAKMPTVERGLVRHTRDVESLKAILAQLVDRKMHLDIANHSKHVPARLLDSARYPIVRTSPRLFHQGVLALLLGTLAAIGCAFFLEYLDRRVKTPQELEDQLGLPIYAAIPAYTSVRRRERRGLRGALVVASKPNSLISEAYRSLRANIRFADGDSEVRVLAITSALPQEGKTVTTLNLATTMAQAGKSVIVVDADLRRPATHTHLGGKLSPGLTDVLSGQDWRSVVSPTLVPNLSTIPAGRRVSNPAALLDSPHLLELLSELREAYDNILFDVPPVLAVSDAAAFFRQLDGVLLLVRYHRTRMEVVEGARDQILRLGGKLLGVVFNAYDARRTSQTGYGRYGGGDEYSSYTSELDSGPGRGGK